MTKIQAWGRLSNTEHQVIPLTTPSDTPRQLQHSTHPGIAHGMGRSYGDAALNGNGILWLTQAMSHLIFFDFIQVSCTAKRVAPYRIFIAP